MSEDDLPDGAFPWIADIRDDVLAHFLSLYPKPLLVEYMRGYFGIDAVLAQLVIAEFLSHQLLLEADDGSLLLTDQGFSFANARLIKRAGWADHCTRPSAPEWPKLGRRLDIAMDIYASHYADSIAARMIREMREREGNNMSSAAE